MEASVHFAELMVPIPFYVSRR